MWQQIKQLTEQRGTILAEMKGILNKAQEEKRELTPEQSTQFDTLNAKAEGIQQNIERCQKVYQFEQQAASGNGGGNGTEQRIGRQDVNTPEQQTDAAA